MGQSTSSLGRRATRSDPGGSGRRTRDVQALFDLFAHALTVGDGAAIAGLWETPAFVLGDGTVRCVSSPSEVQRLFTAVKKRYVERAVTGTRAEVVRLEWLTKQMAMVEIHWPHLDVHGKEVGGEHSTYALRRDEHGALKIRAVFIQGEELGQTATA